MSDFVKVNTVYNKYFGESPVRPARSCVGVAQLPKGAKIEVEAVAVSGS